MNYGVHDVPGFGTFVFMKLISSLKVEIWSTENERTHIRRLALFILSFATAKEVPDVIDEAKSFVNIISALWAYLMWKREQDKRIYNFPLK
ncbi:hypothetical protein RCL_jg5968.t1 [Rhizophagus clarus]|uniref:Uncharacterized protein n=1 Tax=Rhizophagus clarus TaxID=94130 RepID=A0A8H3LYB8_9GLOM|nr:hypothetical protein RCL_jg5968.t1 [Rhizophagus clarus]